MAIWRTVVQTSYVAPGGPGYMTFHFRDAGGTQVPDDLAPALVALRDAFTAGRSIFPSNTRFSASGVWQEVDGTREVTGTAWSVDGTNTSGSVMPGNVSVVIGWRTLDRTRSGRGRTFLSGYLSSSSVDGTPSPAVLTSAQAIAQGIVTFNSGLGDGAFVVYSRTQGIARDITGFAVRDVWASLRSRRD